MWQAMERLTGEALKAFLLNGLDDRRHIIGTKALSRYY